MVDLHMHTTASDGTDTPQTVIEKCAKLKLQICSITDHDNIDAQKIAIKSAKQYGLPYVSGVEISVRYEGELHILGYGVDVFEKSFSGEMEGLREWRVARVHKIVELLKTNNISITFDEIEKFAQGNTLGRPHIALALIEKGYAQNIPEAFNKYLNEKGLCYVARRKLDAKYAIELIRSAGGTAVLAHPKLIRTNDIGGLIEELVDCGLQGIEAYYPSHSDGDVEKFVEIAKENNLIVTAGSDYHGKIRENSAIASEKRTGPLLEKSVKFLLERYAL